MITSSKEVNRRLCVKQTVTTLRQVWRCGGKETVRLLHVAAPQEESKMGFTMESVWPVFIDSLLIRLTTTRHSAVHCSGTRWTSVSDVNETSLCTVSIDIKTASQVKQLFKCIGHIFGCVICESYFIHVKVSVLLISDIIFKLNVGRSCVPSLRLLKDTDLLTAPRTYLLSRSLVCADTN